MGYDGKFRDAVRFVFFLMVLLVLLAAVEGCNSPDNGKTKVQPPLGGVLLKGAGATFPSLLYRKWFAEYHNSHPDTVISYEAVGSGEGIRRFIGKNVKEDDKVDFGGSDAAMKDEEIAQVPGGVLLLPVTAGSVVLAYNLPGFDGDLRLSRKAYAGIFSGVIKKWNDPIIVRSNPRKKLPDIYITTVVRQDRSGTTFAFTNHLDAISQDWHSRHGAATLVNWPGNAMRATGSEGVAGRIKQAIGSIGYVSYEFAHNLGLKLAVLENREGKFVAPTADSYTASFKNVVMPGNLRIFIPDPAGPDSYPIVTFSWILLYKDYNNPEKSKAIHDLFNWCLLEGQKFAPQIGYVQLPPDVVDKALAALDSVTQTAAGHK